MKPEEAKKHIHAFVIAYCEHIPKQVVEALNVAREALEKEIPKKPVLTPQNFFSYGECNCGMSIPTFTWKYCPKCGQRIDWPESEAQE